MYWIAAKLFKAALDVNFAFLFLISETYAHEN